MAVVSEMVTKIRESRLAVIVMVGVAASFFAVAVALPNIGLIAHVVGSDSFTLAGKAMFLGSVIESYTTNFNVLSQVVIGLTALLAGVNAALFVVLLRQRSQAMGGSMFSMGGGAFAGMLGIGCASCGSIILTSILPILGISVVGLLPFGGAEFGIIGVGILAYAAKRTLGHIQAPLVCEPVRNK